MALEKLKSDKAIWGESIALPGFIGTIAILGGKLDAIGGYAGLGLILAVSLIIGFVMYTALGGE